MHLDQSNVTMLGGAIASIRASIGAESFQFEQILAHCGTGHIRSHNAPFGITPGLAQPSAEFFLLRVDVAVVRPVIPEQTVEEVTGAAAELLARFHVATLSLQSAARTFAWLSSPIGGAYHTSRFRHPLLRQKKKCVSVCEREVG